MLRQGPGQVGVVGVVGIDGDGEEHVGVDDDRAFRAAFSANAPRGLAVPPPDRRAPSLRGADGDEAQPTPEGRWEPGLDRQRLDADAALGGDRRQPLDQLVGSSTLTPTTASYGREPRSALAGAPCRPGRAGGAASFGDRRPATDLVTPARSGISKFLVASRLPTTP